MIVAGRRDYALMTEVLLVKPVKKSEKSNFLKYPVSPVNTGDGVVVIGVGCLLFLYRKGERGSRQTLPNLREDKH